MTLNSKWAGLAMLFIAVGLLFAVASTARSERNAEPTRKPIKSIPPPSSEAHAPSLGVPQAYARPKVAEAGSIARGMQDGRLYSIYQTFRTSIATGNRALEQALRELIGTDRGAILQLAQADLASAKDQVGREIAARTLEALRK